MKNRLMHILKFGKADWHHRVIAAGGAFALTITLLVFFTFYFLDRQVSKRITLDNMDMLSMWLSEANAPALSSGRPELSKIGNIIGYPGVKGIMTFDLSGRLFAPLSMHGERFSDMEMFKKVVSRKKPVRLVNDKGMFEIFKPVFSSGDTSGDVCGLVYLAMSRAKTGDFVFVAILGFFIIILISLFVFWLIRSTWRSVGAGVKHAAGERFDLLRNGLDSVGRNAVSGAALTFEAVLRKLVHFIFEPAFILDGQCRLKEINEAGVRQFGGNGGAVEGTHVADLLKGSDFRELVMRLLPEAENSPDTIVNVREGGLTVSMFSSHEEVTNFKYAVLCGEGRIIQ